MRLNNKIFLFFIIALCTLTGCKASDNKTNQTPSEKVAYSDLKQQLQEAVKKEPATIGIAVIVDGKDTITVNDDVKFPLMSMFKLHEAIAVCRTLDNQHLDLNKTISLNKAALNHDTWSPMLKDYTQPQFDISVKDLIRYILIDSDNNASNVLFEQVVSVEETDSIIRQFLNNPKFKLVHTEAKMQARHELSYENWSSPLAYATLIERVFKDSLVSNEKQMAIKQAMIECNTGLNRIAASFKDHPDVKFAHRTGSGYINERGEVIAVNDGGYVILPNGHAYSIAVFVKEYAGPQDKAEEAIARISGIIYDKLSVK